MKHITSFAGLILFLTFFSCKSNQDNGSTQGVDRESVTPQMVDEKTEIVVERKQIKEGHLTFETQNLAETRKTIFAAVDKYKAYVASDQEYITPDRINNTMIIRIPKNEYDQFVIDATAGVDIFESKTVNIEDVTEEYLDIEARLKVKKEVELRYIQLLKQAKNVTEIMEVEKQIGTIREEIESIEGRLNFLQNQVSFSTLTLNFYETQSHPTKFGEKFAKSIKNGWTNLIWVFVFLANIWPFILLGFGVIFGIRKYRQRNRNL